MRSTMPQGRGMTLNLPPFTPAIVWIIGVNAAVFLLLVLLAQASSDIVRTTVEVFALRPNDILRGFIWQLLTYGFLHLGFGHFFWNMFGLWMFGSAVEGGWGSRRFLELYIAGILGAGMFSFVLSLTNILGSPNTTTLGASGGLYAVLMAFGIVYAENEIILFPFPFRIKAKYFVAILIFVTIVFSVGGSGSGVSHLAHLGGLLTGYLYVRFAPARGLRAAGSDPRGRWLDLKSWFYRWKRRRAARKFEVYMRKHDRSVYFDEHGNYRAPEDEPPKDKENGEGSPPWVN